MGKRKEITGKDNGKQKMWTIITVIIVFFAMAGYAGMSYYYSDRFFRGTTINGINCSGKTSEEAEQAVAKKAEDYLLEVKARNLKSQSINGKLIGYRYVSDGSISQYLDEQKPYKWVRGFWKKQNYTAKENMTYDKVKLKEQLEKLECVKKENQTAPEDAYVAYGICYRSVMSYQNQYKCNTEEAITHFIELKKNKEIIFRNRKWASIKTCCEFYDLNEDSVKTDIWNRKCTPQEAIERAIEWKKAHEITYHGVKYPSLPQCCEDLGINPISVRLYMEKNGVSSTRAITHYIKSKEKRAFEFRGKEYKNFTECCLAYGLKPKSVSSAVFKAKRPHADVMEEIISHMEGCMPKEVTKKEEIPENQVMSKERHRAKEAFFYEGNKYISLGQCCEFYGINESSVRSRAWRKKCTWEEAVKYYIQKKETETPKMQFFYKGKKYKSVSACCAEYGVNASSVRNRAKTTECSIEASLDHFIKKARMEIQPSLFIFRDKTYRSLEECCLEYGVNADSVSSRKYRLNCTMEESLEHFIENKDMIAERIQKFKEKE